MPNYRRWRQEGGCFFLTVVTYGREPIFADSTARALLHDALAQVGRRRPWRTDAMVLLPDHWHALWRMPEADTDYSTRLCRVKKDFTDACLVRGGRQGEVTAGQGRARRRGVWQRRFMEHTIRDARDFKIHLDYIHVNPVKHGLAKLPRDWPWSSFHRWVDLGEYEPEWCGRAELAGDVEYYWDDD